VAEQGENDPADNACLTLLKLERILALDIDTYNHSSDKENPSPVARRP